MKTRPIIAVLAAGASLTMSACSGRVERPTPDPPPPPPPGNPPAPAPEPEVATLPTWDDVVSEHPEGATNPPIPHLYVTAAGDCYKDWVSPFIAAGPDGKRDRVRTDCDTEPCGTPIVCPEDRAERLISAWQAEQAAGAGTDADSE